MPTPSESDLGHGFSLALSNLSRIHEEEVEVLNAEVRRLREQVRRSTERNAHRVEIKAPRRPGDGEAQAKEFDPPPRDLKGPRKEGKVLRPVRIVETSPRPSTVATPEGSPAGTPRGSDHAHDKGLHAIREAMREGTQDSSIPGESHWCHVKESDMAAVAQEVAEEMARPSVRNSRRLPSVYSNKSGICLPPQTPMERWEHLVACALVAPPHKLMRRGLGLAEICWDLNPIWSLRAGPRNQFAKSLIEQENSIFFRQGTKLGDVMTSRENPLQPFIINPSTLKFLVWSMLGLVMVLVDIVTVPLQVFDFGEFTESLQLVSYVTFAYWLADLLRSFLTGYDGEGVTEMRPRHVARKYLTTWFVFDFTIILVDIILFSFDAIMHTNNALAQAGSRSIRMFRLTRLGRLLRLLRLGKLKRLDAYGVLGMINSEYIRLIVTILQYVGFIMVVNHYVACVFYALADFASEDKHTWVDQYIKESEHYPDNAAYILAFHWSITQFGPSTNNIAPQNVSERIFASLVVVFALVMFSSFVSTITNAVNQLRRFNMARLMEEKRTREFISTRHISVSLSVRINSFINQHYQDRKRRVQEKDIEALQEIPESMKIQLHEEVYMPFLVKCPAFSEFIDVNKPTLTRICHHAMTESCFDAQKDIFLMDKEALQVYHVVAGSLHYRSPYLEHLQPAFKVRADSWVSEMAMWVTWFHLGQLTADNTVDIVELDCSQVHAMLAGTGGALLACMRKLAVYLATYAEENEQSERPVTDLPIDPMIIEDMATRAYKMWEMGGKSSVAPLTLIQTPDKAMLSGQV